MHRSTDRALLPTIVLFLGLAFCVPTAHGQHLPAGSTDTLLHIHETSLAEQPGYTSFVLAYPSGEEQTVWIGDPVLTIHPHQVRRLSIERRDRDGRVLIVYLDRATSQQFASLTGDFVNKHLAFSIAGQVIQVPRVYEPIQGGKIALFNVPDDLLSAYVAAIPHALDDEQ